MSNDIVKTGGGKLSTLENSKFKDLLMKRYPTLTEESEVFIPFFGSEHDSVIFLVLDDPPDTEYVTDDLISYWIKEKKIVGLGWMYGPAIWLLEPGAEYLGDEQFKNSLWGSEEGMEESMLAEYDPYGIMSGKPNLKQFVNLTEFPVNLNDGRTFEPSGLVARVQLGTTKFDANLVCTVSSSDVVNLPNPISGTLFIVSGFVLTTVREIRQDCVVAAIGHPDCIRVNGKIVSVPGFIR